MKSRPMALTPDLVARVHRVVEDAGQEPGLSYQTDEDYDAAVETTLASHPAGQDTWLLAYGSLIWKPEVEHVQARKGTARGWHRLFCFRIVSHRATKDQPSLMMASTEAESAKGFSTGFRARTYGRSSGSCFGVSSRSNRKTASRAGSVLKPSRERCVPWPS
jgi:glutathione-specific gamma-glutamylcyclotransferase